MWNYLSNHLFHGLLLLLVLLLFLSLERFLLCFDAFWLFPVWPVTAYCFFCIAPKGSGTLIAP